MSLIQLVCKAEHAVIPALVAGNVITLVRTKRGFEVRAPGTPNILQRLAQALREGALAITDASDPGLRELEAEIRAERDRLLAEADTLLAQIREEREARLAG